MGWLIGIDVGGTFTDFYALEAGSGEVRLFKRPSTPANPAEAIILGLTDLLAEFGIDPKDVERVGHGTTVATNALIQRKGGKVALITTEGFRDLLEIGRQTRPHMYSLQQDHPDPLVPRERRIELAERCGPGGEVLKAPDAEDIKAAAEAALATGAEAIAVCFLFAYLNGSHEAEVGAAVNAVSDIQVSLSSEVQPEFREYERFSTTVLNAYLQPVMGRYLTYLEDEMAKLVSGAPVGIYQSSGGVMSIDTARNFPVRTALSGPAAGAVGAIYSAALSERPNVITLDMGGTSADVALIRDYDAGTSMDRDVAGFPVRLPMVDIHTVGAGGGSIAWFERDGLLKVGPASAGADPGPACYGRGGAEPTVTDANLLLGRLSPGGLVGGRMSLDPALSRKALAPAAERLGYSPEETALGVLGIVTANMVRAIRTVSVERGHDPRDYVLMPFGGAGALHAGDVARSLGIKEILVPYAPGILCAQGLIVSDLKEDFVHSERLLLGADALAPMASIFEDLSGRAAAWFRSEDVTGDARRIEVLLDMRYVGQNFELAVTLPAADDTDSVTAPDLETLRQAFFEAHTRQYGYHSGDDPVELVNVRMTSVGRLGRGKMVPKAADAGPPDPIDTRPVWFEAAGPVDTPVYDRATFRPGFAILGPAVIQQLDATTVLHPGDTLRVDDALNLLIEVDL